MTTARISTRESDVLTLLGEHLSNAEIAARLFISVRTVESHVSSLLRKLQLPDRRALSRHATTHTSPTPRPPAAATLPAPLTAFVGRRRERTELAETLRTHRHVTAIGPGGVGKTRLALATAEDMTGEFPDGVWFVDLVPVTDPHRVSAAVAAALGTGEQPGHAVDDAVLTTLAGHRALLVLDNCEHLRDGVAPFVERLLAHCPRLKVLATSRARLMVPFERAFPVPPLSCEDGDESDAVALFMDRAAAVGWPPGPAVSDGVTALCQGLGGMALAIELAAARWPTLGLDGLTTGLDDQLRILTGGARADDRHRSVRAVLDWSHDLLEPHDRILLRRVSVFVAPFTAEAATHTAAFAPLTAATVPDALARLAEQSLLTATPTPAGTCYHALETIRQYGTEQLAAAAETDTVRSRHLTWCLTAATALTTDHGEDDRRARFDTLADDARAALTWAADEPQHRGDAHRLALTLAGLAFTRNLLGEAQQRYEQAAWLTGGTTCADALRQAAAVAGCRRLGDDIYRLHRAAAQAARTAGDPTAAARDLAAAATAAYRFSTSFTRIPPVTETHALLDQARTLAADAPTARAAVALAEAAVTHDAFGALQADTANTVDDTVTSAERAVRLARLTGDAVTESAALDALSGAHSWAGNTFAAATAARRRIDVLTPAPHTPAAVHEHTDALAMAAGTALGAGDLRHARQWSERLAGHPLLAEAGHQATSWLLTTSALAGHTDDVLTTSERFRDAWEHGGHPRSLSLGAAAASVAMTHGLRGDTDARDDWLTLAERADTPVQHRLGYGAVFDTLVLLHHGDTEAALERTAPEPHDVWKWVCWIWLHWYLALRAETAALTGHPDARTRITTARAVVTGNPVATAQLDRAEALLDGDPDRLAATAQAFARAGCPYQASRTLLLTG